MTFRPAYLIFLIWIGCIALIHFSDQWGAFSEGWPLTLTMCVGSFIAGATSEGGGAVAFPVMTLFLGITPSVARDFALLIQSVGMTSAALLIIIKRIDVEWNAVKWASLGGVGGIIFGLEFVAPTLSPAYAKMFFTSFWLSFGCALFLLNMNRDRAVHLKIASDARGSQLLLLTMGFLGGIVSSISGSGIDLLTFTLLTLYFRLNEKIATPTSVILMAGNAIAGSLWSGVVMNSISEAAWNYWYACIPVVVIGAPLGAKFISTRTRKFIAYLLYASIVIQFVAAILIVPQTPQLLMFSSMTTVSGLLMFTVMMKLSPNKSAILQPPSHVDS